MFEELRAEAERLGLELSIEDLEAIRMIVEPVQRELARLRPLLSQDGEFPYCFTPLGARLHD